MPISPPIYAPSQIVRVYNEVYLIERKGVLDGGEYWYRARQISIDDTLHNIYYLQYRNIPEEDIELLDLTLPADYLAIYNPRM